MASFFQFFWNSSMPKRLLRFALSRYDILDNEALDLQNLDLALGRNTVLEFRDVGIKLHKLEKILKLPPTLSIQKAKVLLLRVTVPVDFYASPITIEVEGVDVRLKVATKEDKEGQVSKKRKTSKDDEAEPVPNVADLTMSFLETEPLAEKKQLEEALAAETQDMAASLAISEADSEDDYQDGMGQALTLPTFLVDFMQGIADRMQIRIHSVAFQMDIEVPMELHAVSSELVTFQIALDEVSVEGVTMPVRGADGTPKIIHKEGKRHISLDNIRAYLISEANVFSSLARSSSMPSSNMSMSPRLSASRPLSRQPTNLSELAAPMEPLSGSEELEQSHYPLQDSEDAFNIPYELDGASDEADQDQEEPASSLSTPRASIYQEHGGQPLRLGAQSEVVEPEPAPWATFDREVQSQPHLPAAGNFGAPLEAPPLISSTHSSQRSDGSDLNNADDLAESHLYSHEDAESMYMSAFSQAESQELRGMPGAWDDSPDSSPSRHPKPAPAAAPSSPSPKMTALGASAQIVAPEVVAGLETPAEDEDLQEEQSKEMGEVETEPLQDDIPTPRGPTRLVKEILSLQSISAYIPSKQKHVQIVQTAPSPGTSPNLPGAFSVHLATSHHPEATPSPSTTESDKEPADKSIEVIFEPLEVRFDASVGFILATVVSKLLEALQGFSEPAVATPDSKPSSPLPEFKLTLQDLSILFLEKLVGVADTPKRVFAPEKIDFSPDVLLKATMQNLSGSFLQSDSHMEANIGIDKLKFGYANDDILSFDKSVKMFESTMDTFPSAGEDINIKIKAREENIRFVVNTLPLHVKLDLQKLDETFSWFGGLSSFLNMGSSMTSSAAKGSRSPARTAQKPRGVRFDAPVKADDKSAAKENKIDLRVNGFRLDLVGRDCSVALDTSALKLVNREEVTAVQFSRIRLSGPHLRNSRARPTAIVDVLNTRLEYLLLPRHDDLERLLELVTPSKVKFDDDNDEIMVEMLLRQRKKGPVLRLTLDTININLAELQQLSCLPSLGEELARLGNVAKYLPEDDRPGLLTLGRIKNLDCSLDVGGRFGTVQAAIKDMDLAHISVPSLAAVAIGQVSVTRNKIEELVSSPGTSATGTVQKPPVVMLRMVDDLEPVLKVHLMGLDIEYRVPTIMDILGLAEDATPQDFEASLAASVANLGDHAQAAIHRAPAAHPGPSPSSDQNKSKPIKVDLALRDCLVGLNPLGLTSKLMLVLTDTDLEVTPGKNATVSAVASLKKASVLLIDDVSLLGTNERPGSSRRRSAAVTSPQVVALCSEGYVDICQISSAKAIVKVAKDEEGEQHVNIEVHDDLLVLETCADSTQTLITLANALKPPTPPSKEIKYRTKVIPMEDLLSSITTDAFGKAEGDYDFDKDFVGMANELEGSLGSEDDFFPGGGRDSGPLDSGSHYDEELPVRDQLFDATSSSLLSGGTTARDTMDGVLLTNMSTANIMDMDDGSSDDLEIKHDYFGSTSVIQGTAHRWDSAKNTYDHANDTKVHKSPLMICVRDVHVIWNLFDGFDWARTRDVITKAVQDVEQQAYERRARTGRRVEMEQDFDEEEAVIGDFLFNSIYIGIPANRDPRELTHAINQELNDNATETESIATTAVTNATTKRLSGHHGLRSNSSKKLKLNRSRYHKITFELKGVNVDLVVFPPGSGETINSIDVRVHDVIVFDHVPTSTWKKFAMYDEDHGEREMGANMLHLELLTTKPVLEMPATEMVLKVTLLPLRLHVDQDALDFITRFFEFKDDSAPVHASPSDVPFIQRAEVNDVPVKLDFKPKRVDYAGLRSGHTTEFMNFLVLEDARLVLRHIIIYGVTGFDRLGKELNDIWTANVKATQLPGVLAGLAPARSLVNAASGFRDLVQIPIREYKKDGRIVRSLGKGAAAFAKTTGTEVVKLGAKLAIGTQYALQGAEGLLVQNPDFSSSAGGGGAGGVGAGVAEWADDDEDMEEFLEEGKQISLYADQPMGIIQGMRGAYTSLTRDLIMAKDAIIAVPGEVMESSSAQGAAKAVLRRAPTIIFRPAIGATKAIGLTLLGATNALDPHNRRRVDAKYKKH